MVTCADCHEPGDLCTCGRRLISVTADRLTMRAPKWLYDWRIPAGAITLLAGREGIGKSTISYDIAAKVTLGTLPGKYLGIPRSVAVVAGEDSWECVILPRLYAAGADATRIYRIEASEDGRTDTISVPVDLADLTDLCIAHGIVLVLLDPLMSVIDGRIDTHKDRDVRRALDPLARFASTTGVTVLGLIHVNKSTTSDPLSSIMASRAFAAVARSVLYCLLDPEAEKEDRYLFGHPKSNLGPKQPTLKYHLIGVKLEIDDEDDPIVVTSRVVWDGIDERTIRDAMEAPRERAESETTTRILEWLSDQGRAVPAAELVAAFSDVKRGTLDKHLSRLVERRKIVRPFHGHYSVAESGTQSGTPLIPSEVPEVPEVPDHPALLAHPASIQVPDRVPEPLSGWASALYDRER